MTSRYFWSSTNLLATTAAKAANTEAHAAAVSEFSRPKIDSPRGAAIKKVAIADVITITFFFEFEFEPS